MSRSGALPHAGKKAVLRNYPSTARCVWRRCPSPCPWTGHPQPPPQPGLRHHPVCPPLACPVGSAVRRQHSGCGHERGAECGREGLPDGMVLSGEPVRTPGTGPQLSRDHRLKNESSFVRSLVTSGGENPHLKFPHQDMSRDGPRGTACGVDKQGIRCLLTTFPA